MGGAQGGGTKQKGHLTVQKQGKNGCQVSITYLNVRQHYNLPQGDTGGNAEWCKWLGGTLPAPLRGGAVGARPAGEALAQPHLQMRKLRLWEVTSLAPGHTASKWLSWDLASGLSSVQGCPHVACPLWHCLRDPIGSTNTRLALTGHYQFPAGPPPRSLPRRRPGHDRQSQRRKEAALLPPGPARGDATARKDHRGGTAEKKAR